MKAYNKKAVSRTFRAGLEVTKVIRERTLLESGDHGMTIGQLVDERIHEMLKNRDEGQTISIHFEPEDWHRMEHEIVQSDSFAGDYGA